MTIVIKDDRITASTEEVAALTSLTIAAGLIEDSAYALAGMRPGKESTYLFLIAANLEKEIQRISGALQN